MIELSRIQLLQAMKAGQRIDGIAIADALAKDRDPFAQDVWLKSFMAPFQRSSIEGIGGADNGEVTLADFEKAADQARARMAGAGAAVAVIKRGELEAAISQAVKALADPAGSGFSAVQHSNMRRGLQIYGVHIADDDPATEGSPLRLANTDLSFSLRFIACSFSMPLSLSSARLVTLDLSGCAVPGVDATFLNLSGSLRLRRLYSSAPLEFTGARIHGFLDGADMVLQPFGAHPSAQAVSPERAMLGLNQVQIDNEVRLQRAQIWGGITMRGLEAKRSIYMSDAVVLCPLAVLEALAKGAVSSPPEAAATGPDYELPGEGEGKRRRKNHAAWRTATWLRGWSNRGAEAGTADSEYKTALSNFETRNTKPGWNRSTLHALLTANLRARTSAIRADGIKVEGSVFLERLCSHGRLRMKYAHIAGGLTLVGARLRSTEALMPTFDQLEYRRFKRIRSISRYRRKTYEALVDPVDQKTRKLARGADIFALDLRESRIEGDVRIGVSDQHIENETCWDTRIDGVVAVDQARLDGRLQLERVIFRWSLRVPRLDQRNKIMNAGQYLEASGKAEDELGKNLISNKQHQLSARGLTTADTVNLCGSQSLKGADFSNATIGGDLLFWAGWKHPEQQGAQSSPAPPQVPPRVRLKLESPAAGLTGASIDVSGAVIGGDLRLLFDPSGGKDQASGVTSAHMGPRIEAERVTVGGLLSIMPPCDQNQEVIANAEIYSTAVNDAIDAIHQHRKMAIDGLVKWEEKYGLWKQDRPKINLANAQATLLEFPPPAWPQAGRLFISGFNYQRALSVGPLAPYRFGHHDDLPKVLETERKIWIIVSAFYLCLAVVLFAVSCWFDLQGLPLFRSHYLLAIIFLISSGYVYLPLRKPRSSQTVPMAIFWLCLQPPERNAYRTKRSLLSKILTCIRWPRAEGRGNLFRSLEPYTVAADALRREGRWVSANLVEQERFRVRNWQLSWRIHLLQKASFKAADWLTGYGYNYARLLFATALTVTFAAMTVEKADDCGAITPKLHKIDGVARAPAEDGAAGAACRMLKPGKAGATEIGSHPQDKLDVMLFAADTVLPIMDLGEVAEWDVNKQTTALSPWWWDWLESLVTYARLLAMFHTLGLLLAGVLLLGLSTRFGQWLSRYGD